MEKMWSQQQIEEVIKNFNTRQGGNAGGFSVPFHRHNGSDSNRVQADDLVPYSIITSLDVNPQTRALTNPAGQGQSTLFDYSRSEYIPGQTLYDWGQSIYIGNNGASGGQPNKIWADLHLADFYLSVSKTNTQTIASGNTDTIVFNALPEDTWYPTGAYSTTTGIFSVIQNQDGNTQTYNGWNSPTPYLVTASVGLAPDTAVVPGESADINIEVDGAIIYWNRFYFPSATDIVVATISTIMFTPIESDIKITISNNTSDTLTTNIAGVEQITYFKLKQLK